MVGYGDFNKIGNNLVYLKEHADKATAPVHGSTNEETANKLMHRDASGRARVADPDDDKDIVNKQTLVAHSGLTDNPHATTKTHVGLNNVDNVKQMPIAGGTFTGRAAAHSPDTGYTTKQLRNFFASTAAPTTEGENGDVWLQYEV